MPSVTLRSGPYSAAELHHLQAELERARNAVGSWSTPSMWIDGAFDLEHENRDITVEVALSSPPHRVVRCTY